MKFTFGRNNLALTVFVPFDCDNACHFCESKATYSKFSANARDVSFQLSRVLSGFRYPIWDVVFTGGEPMKDIDELKKLIALVPDRLNVYINTCLLKTNLDDFVELVNTCNKIKGINVSRHCETYESDCMMLNDIAPDCAVKRFKKPVRINCVVENQKIESIISRWEKYADNTNLCFRRNFNRDMEGEELHDIYDTFLIKLVSLGLRYYNHTQCNVCDTTRFKRGNFVVSYHKGMKHSSIYNNDTDTLEINDLIIFQDGRLAYDWENSEIRVISDLELQYRDLHTISLPHTTINDYDLFGSMGLNGCGCNQPHELCGGGGCGGGCGGYVGGCGGNGCGGGGC